MVYFEVFCSYDVIFFFVFYFSKFLKKFFIFSEVVLIRVFVEMVEGVKFYICFGIVLIKDSVG